MKYLNIIMDTNMDRTHKFESMDEIHEFESKFKLNLPTAYKLFLLQYGSGYVKDNYYFKAKEWSPLTPRDGYNSTNYFYGRDIVDNIAIYDEELESKLLPIADTGGGDFICLGVKGEGNGKIYYWSHEGVESLVGNLYLIADTFEHFIFSFEEKEQEIPLGDIELFLDDDLLND